jgi:hypothetical protein
MRIRAVTLHLMWNDDFSVVDMFLQAAEASSLRLCAFLYLPRRRTKRRELSRPSETAG